MTKIDVPFAVPAGEDSTPAPDCGRACGYVCPGPGICQTSFGIKLCPQAVSHADPGAFCVGYARDFART